MEVMECEGVFFLNDMEKPKDEEKQNYEGRKNMFVDWWLISDDNNKMKVPTGECK